MYKITRVHQQLQNTLYRNIYISNWSQSQISETPRHWRFCRKTLFFFLLCTCHCVYLSRDVPISCRSIDFSFVRDQTKLSYRNAWSRVIGRTERGQLTFRAMRASTFHRHHLHNPFGTHLGRSAAATTRLETIHSWTRGGASWRSARDMLLSLLFARNFSSESSARTERWRTGN